MTTTATGAEVISPGPLTTIQDLGRPGWGHLGVPCSGAADRPALALANRLVGNEAGAAALETTLSGPSLRFDGPMVVAVTGAEVEGIAMNTPLALDAGEVLKIGTATRGLRTYVALRGGLEAPLTLGSAATDVLTGLGPRPLARGDVLRTRGDPPRMRGERASGAPPRASPPADDLPDLAKLRLILGPRDDWFTADAITDLIGEPFTVAPASNRIGLRLTGPRLDRARRDELLSEGLVPGAIQVPRDGQPIVLLFDHPTTGGYPVIAVVHSEDLPLVAQLRPGRQVRFRPIAG